MEKITRIAHIRVTEEEKRRFKIYVAKRKTSFQKVLSDYIRQIIKED